ncbi:hypothetical protein IT409_03055 [Candidatus Falkowbacteria bacterium]|nr:hypothetical protein [Candidatus Falkowbacteria bacterium]
MGKSHSCDFADSSTALRMTWLGNNADSSTALRMTWLGNNADFSTALRMTWLFMA